MATEALDQAGTPWCLSFTSSSLNGLSAATEAGWGYSIRTGLDLQQGTELLSEGAFGLPQLPSIALTLHRREGGPEPLTERLSCCRRYAASWLTDGFKLTFRGLRLPLNQVRGLGFV